MNLNVRYVNLSLFLHLTKHLQFWSEMVWALFNL
jgi:hypothetical protein